MHERVGYHLLKENSQIQVFLVEDARELPQEFFSLVDTKFNSKQFTEELHILINYHHITITCLVSSIGWCLLICLMVTNIVPVQLRKKFLLQFVMMTRNDWNCLSSTMR
jgi:hypothetical protein